MRINSNCVDASRRRDSAHGERIPQSNGHVIDWLTNDCVLNGAVLVVDVIAVWMTSVDVLRKCYGTFNYATNSMQRVNLQRKVGPKIYCRFSLRRDMSLESRHQIVQPHQHVKRIRHWHWTCGLHCAEYCVKTIIAIYGMYTAIAVRKFKDSIHFTKLCLIIKLRNCDWRKVTLLKCVSYFILVTIWIVPHPSIKYFSQVLANRQPV